jgi:hypothetical protein
MELPPLALELHDRRCHHRSDQRAISVLFKSGQNLREVVELLLEEGPPDGRAIARSGARGCSASMTSVVRFAEVREAPCGWFKSNVVVLDPDVAAVFPDAESLNSALRALAAVVRARAKKRAAR